MASEKVLHTNVSLWQKWLKSVKASQCNADGNFWKHLCNNVTVLQCNGVTFNQGWCTTGDKVTRVKSAKSDCTILNACHCMQMELVESLEGDELRDAVRLYNRCAASWFLIFCISFVFVSLICIFARLYNRLIFIFIGPWCTWDPIYRSNVCLNKYMLIS